MIWGLIYGRGFLLFSLSLVKTLPHWPDQSCHSCRMLHKTWTSSFLSTEEMSFCDICWPHSLSIELHKTHSLTPSLTHPITHSTQHFSWPPPIGLAVPSECQNLCGFHIFSRVFIAEPPLEKHNFPRPEKSDNDRVDNLMLWKLCSSTHQTDDESAGAASSADDDWEFKLTEGICEYSVTWNVKRHTQSFALAILFCSSRALWPDVYVEARKAKHLSPRGTWQYNASPLDSWTHSTAY